MRGKPVAEIDGVELREVRSYTWRCEKCNLKLGEVSTDQQAVRLTIAVHLQMKHGIKYPTSHKMAGVKISE